MSFQENLRYYRTKAGYKQAKEFANILGISYTTYTSYENQGREPKYKTLCKIADLLKVSTDDLLGRTTNIIGNKDNDEIKRLIITSLKQNRKTPFKIKLINIDETSINLKIRLRNNIGDVVFQHSINIKDFINILKKINHSLENEKLNVLSAFFRISSFNQIVNDLQKQPIKKDIKELEEFSGKVNFLMSLASLKAQDSILLNKHLNE